MDEVAVNVRDCLVAIEGMRLPAVRHHEGAVSGICGALCDGMGLEAGLASILRFAAGLHDIGKLVIPERIINKPRPLDPDEWQVMRKHPQLGFDILRGSDNDAVKVAASVVLRHHECWDGSGYPDGLAGEAIPREARIVGICDAYHALRETRPYRAGLSHDTVMGMLLEGDATGRLHPGKFDPVVLAAFRASADAVRAAFDAAA